MPFVTLLIFALILGLLVMVHEFGHFVIARLFRIKVEEFAFGFPPRLLSIVRGGTTYALNLVPIGGYVKIKGEEGGGHNEPDSFASRPIYQRAAVLFAGVTMNVVLAFVLVSSALMIGYPDIIEGNAPSGATLNNRELHVTEVRPALPASESLALGDVIVAIDGERPKDLAAFQDYLAQHENQIVRVTFKRDDELIDKALTPIYSPEEGRAIIGVGLVETGLVSYSPLRAIEVGFVKTGELLYEIVRAFASLISDLVVHHRVDVPLSGPVGIAVLTGFVVKLGFSYLLQFTALLSLNLALINILPIPALDGGRIFFLLLEKLKGRPVTAQIENLIHRIGFTVLLLLIAVVTYRDIAQWGGDIVRALKRTIGV